MSTKYSVEIKTVEALASQAGDEQSRDLLRLLDLKFSIERRRGAMGNLNSPDPDSDPEEIVRDVVRIAYMAGFVEGMKRA